MSDVTMTELLALPTPADMVEGYFDGFSDTREEFPEPSNRSEAYRHGWLNGRDDRIGQPRAGAQHLRNEAARIIRAGMH